MRIYEIAPLSDHTPWQGTGSGARLGHPGLGKTLLPWPLPGSVEARGPLLGTRQAEQAPWEAEVCLIRRAGAAGRLRGVPEDARACADAAPLWMFRNVC